MKRRLLIVDDDRLLCRAVHDHLASAALDVATAHTSAEALRAIAEEPVDVVVLDQRLPDGDGQALCEPILRLHGPAKIVFATAYPSFESAVGALKSGAHDYLCKPFELDHLALAVRRCLERLDLEKVERFDRYRRARDRADTMLIGAAGLASVRELVERAAEADCPVLVTGETGTGKNLVAKAIHHGGSRREKPFVHLNCAALPETLIEAELFGWERGAFTGAAGAREGVFEVAEGGTLFLDELGEMPLHLQAKLLSVLEDKEVKRLGGRLAHPVDVRVIAATNADIEARVAEGRFRADLFYRLEVMRVRSPPLRERPGDLPALCEHLLERIAAGRTLPPLAPGELDRLAAYPWPGNVRELKNVLERAAVLQREALRPSELLSTASAAAGHSPVGEAAGEAETLAVAEQRHVETALRRESGNLARTARALGISLSTLKRKVKEYALGRAG